MADAAVDSGDRRPSRLQQTRTVGGARRRKVNRSLCIGFVLVLCLVLADWIGPGLLSHDPITQDLSQAMIASSTVHPLGTDQFGRDVLARILFGLRVDLQIGVFATLYTMTLGVLLGALCGYFGGWVDTLVMRLVDILIAFPDLVLTIGIVAMLGPGLLNLYIAIGMVGWISYARLVRAEVLAAKELEYVQAARVIGATDRRIIWRHLLPNVISPAIVFAMSDVVWNVFAAGALGFLGLGVQPPLPELGVMIADGRKFILSYPYLAVFPGLAVGVVGVAFSLLGDGLADYLRPSA